MDRKQIINYRQFSWLTASLLGGGGLVSVQQALIRINSMDAWLSYTLPTLYVIALGYVFGRMVRRFPGKNMFEITKLLFGGLIGTVVNLILLIHLWLILVRDLGLFSKFIGITLLPNTPEEIVVTLFVLLLLYYGKTSIEIVARVNDLVFPFFVIMILALPLMLANETDQYLLLPMMIGSVKNFLSGNMVSIGWYGDVFVMGAFLHTLWDSKQIQASIRHGVFLASLLIGIFLLLEVLVLGPYMPGNFLYPSYSLVQQIHITDFLDRMDLIILSIWFPVTACKVITIYLAFITGIASLVNQRDYTSINTPVVLLLLLTTLLSFKSATEMFSFGIYSSPVIVLSYQPVLFLFIWLFCFRHPVQRSVQPEHKTGTQNGQMQGDGEQTSEENKSRHEEPRENAADGQKNRKPRGRSNPVPGMFQVLSFEGWKRLSNLLLLVCLVCVIAGYWAGKLHTAVGIVCAIVYGISSIAVVFSSSMELRISGRQNG